MPFYGITVTDGEVKVSKSRTKESAAEKLAASVEGAQHRFVVEADDEAEAHAAAVAQLVEEGVLAEGGDAEGEPAETEGGDAEGEVEPAVDGDAEPTPEELAEAAALIESAGGEVELAAARTEAPAARTTTPRVTRPKPLFFAAGLADDGSVVLSAGKASLEEVDLSDLEGAGDLRVTVRAFSAEEATDALTELEGKLPEDGFVDTLPKVVVPGSIVWKRPTSVESDRYLVAKSGMLHADENCRFVRGRLDSMVTLTGNPQAAAQIHRGAVLTADDGKRKASMRCVFCAGVTTPAEAAAAAEGAAAAEEAEVSEQTTEATEANVGEAVSA